LAKYIESKYSLSDCRNSGVKAGVKAVLGLQRMDFFIGILLVTRKGDLP
jgi:hypothetical protein